MNPDRPTGPQFLAQQIGNLHIEVATALDQLKAKDAEIEALKAELAKLKAPESDGA